MTTPLEKASGIDGPEPPANAPSECRRLPHGAQSPSHRARRAVFADDLAREAFDVDRNRRQVEPVLVPSDATESAHELSRIVLASTGDPRDQREHADADAHAAGLRARGPVDILVATR